ncbi:MAG: hypothetical protein D3903_04580 [Candidatus Electrothrix sp. GM3_4]|nr:hypothetical protein [Candidatus Electrothrix sp. GM3_4]
MCCVVLLTLFVGCGNVSAKKFDEGTVSAINLDVLRIEACASGKGCIAASGPMQLDLLDMAEDNINYVNQVLLPKSTKSIKELRLVLGENSTITVNDEPFPLVTPHDLIKLKGQKIFGQEGGFLSSLTLNLDLGRQLTLRKKKIGSTGKGKDRKITFASFYKLRQNIRESVEITPMTEGTPAVVAMPDEESEIKVGETFSLVIPAGAVSEPMVISVKERKFTVEVMDEETGEVVEKPALSLNYELSPDGAKFGEPLVITLPYYPDVLPLDVSEDDLAVYLDAEKMPTDINTVSKTATADVWHFTNATVSYPQATGNFIFPFKERDKVWQLCQGYNTPKISHGSAKYPNLIHAFDFAYGTGNLGSTGCWAEEWGNNDYASEDKTVIAPADGWIIRNYGDITVFQLKVPVSNGHGKQVRCVKLGHMKNSDRMSADPENVLPQKTPIGKLSGPTNSAGGYAHVHMAAYATTNCTGVTVPFGTVFGSGYPDFSSNGSKYQWHGTKIPAGDDPEDPEPTPCPSGNGAYCGSVDSSLNDNTLYYCQDGNYQALERCFYDCEVMSSGTSDRCSYGADSSLRAVYRFWSDQNQSHFYTISENERNTVIEKYTDYQWKYEGVAWYAYITLKEDSRPVYRFWSDQNQSHFYTISETEKQYVEDTYSDDQWQYERIEWNAFNYAKAGTIPVYRFWSDQNQSHFYTASKDEKNVTINTFDDYEWKYEGIAWYVFRNP